MPRGHGALEGNAGQGGRSLHRVLAQTAGLLCLRAYGGRCSLELITNFAHLCVCSFLLGRKK